MDVVCDGQLDSAVNLSKILIVSTLPTLASRRESLVQACQTDQKGYEWMAIEI